jgi:hypothetical protein
MSWQYRKSKKVGPFRFTASKRGISSSIGLGGLRYTRRADGSYQRTVRIPGTGIRNTTRIGSSRQPQSAGLGGFAVGYVLGRLLFWPALISESCCWSLHGKPCFFGESSSPPSS